MVAPVTSELSPYGEEGWRAGWPSRGSCQLALAPNRPPGDPLYAQPPTTRKCIITKLDEFASSSQARKRMGFTWLRPKLGVICLAVISAGLTLGQEEGGSGLSDNLSELWSGEW